MKKTTIETNNKISRAHGSANFILFLLFIIASNVTVAQQYDINDPRNPNCPCHKMQQLADKEFAMLTNQDSEVEKDSRKPDNKQVLNDVQLENQKSLNNSIEKSRNTSMNYDKVKRRQKNTWIKKTAFKFSNKYRFQKRKKVNVAICYKWAN
jgi:hypothetical protein